MELKDNRMKVIMVDSLMGNDYSTCLCEKLHDLGIEVHLIVPENRQFEGDEKFIINYLSPSKGGEKNRIIKFFEFIKYFVNLYKYIIKNNPTVVHYQFFRRRGSILFFKLLKLRKIKLIHTAHNVLPHENKRLDYYLKSVVYKNSKFIIVHSNFIKDKLLKSFPIISQKIKVVPHGNFDIYLAPKATNSTNSRKYLGLKQTDNVILFFGYIREYKGLDILLKAFELSALKDPQLKLVIAGSAQKGLEQIYSEKIESSKYKDRIIYHPMFIPKEDVAKYFLASDAVILPYKNIDHSGIIHLAYSFSKPVIATNVGDFCEVIENNKSGILLKGDSFEELSEIINIAFKNKKELTKMGKYARQLSNTKYSWDDVAQRTINVYKEAT